MSDEKMHSPRQAARLLGISYSAIKQWIYKNKIKTVKTAGGHHRIPNSELDRFLYRSTEGAAPHKRRGFRQVSGRNQLVGRISEVKIHGLVAQVTLSIGGQSITGLITADAAREMQLKSGQVAVALIKSTDVMILRPSGTANNAAPDASVQRD